MVRTVDNFENNFEMQQKVLCFFNHNSTFVPKQTVSKKSFLHANLIFSVHNVVLDTIMLDFLTFLLKIFFSKRLKPLIFLY